MFKDKQYVEKRTGEGKGEGEGGERERRGQTTTSTTHLPPPPPPPPPCPPPPPHTHTHTKGNKTPSTFCSRWYRSARKSLQALHSVSEKPPSPTPPPHVTLVTVLMLVWLNTDHEDPSQPRVVERHLLSFSTPFSDTKLTTKHKILCMPQNRLLAVHCSHHLCLFNQTQGQWPSAPQHCLKTQQGYYDYKKVRKLFEFKQFPWQRPPCALTRSTNFLCKCGHS